MDVRELFTTEQRQIEILLFGANAQRQLSSLSLESKSKALQHIKDMLIRYEPSRTFRSTGSGLLTIHHTNRGGWEGESRWGQMHKTV